MADKPTQAGQVISEVSQAEGGPYKGSTAAQMQSQVTRERNFEQAAEEVGAKMQVEPENVTTEVGFALEPFGKYECANVGRRMRHISNLAKLERLALHVSRTRLAMGAYVYHLL